MQALVIYESMYGNTHAIAEAIATGLGDTHDVTVRAVGEVDPATLDGLDLLVLGGPTHVHGMSRAASRETAEQSVQDSDTGLELDPGPNEPGVRGWLRAMDRLAVDAAAFDTRLDAAAILTGRASRGIARQLEHHGARLVTEPESFLVDTDNVLVAGEIERAHAWGAEVGAAQEARSIV